MEGSMASAGIVTKEGRKAVKGMGNVTTPRTCRVTRLSRGIIVSQCTHIHTDLPLYMCLLFEQGLVSALGRDLCLRRSRLLSGLTVCLPAYPRTHGIAVGACDFVLICPHRRETRSTTTNTDPSTTLLFAREMGISIREQPVRPSAGTSFPACYFSHGITGWLLDASSSSPCSARQ